MGRKLLTTGFCYNNSSKATQLIIEEVSDWESLELAALFTKVDKTLEELVTKFNQLPMANLTKEEEDKQRKALDIKIDCYIYAVEELESFFEKK